MTCALCQHTSMRYMACRMSTPALEEWLRTEYATPEDREYVESVLVERRKSQPRASIDSLTPNQVTGYMEVMRGGKP